MKALLAAGAILTASLVGIGAPAAAQQYPPQPPNVTLNLSITILNFGGTVNLTFIGCLIGESVSVNFNGGSSITSCFGSGGGASRSLAAPSAGGMAIASVNAPSTPGVYPITVTGLTSGFTATRNVTVTGAPAAPPAAATPEAASAEAAAPAAGSPRAASPAATSAASAPLPATGSASAPLLWIAGSTLLAGVGLTGVALRRRQHPAAA